MKRTDYTSKIIGHLTVIEKTINKNSSGCIYITKCKCGELKEVASGTLRRAIREGYKLSCGKCKYATIKNNVNSDIAAFNSLYSFYKSQAKTRKILFDINQNEFRLLTKSNCYYCGETPLQIKYNFNKNGKYLYNGLDRLNPKLNYTIDNVVPSCGKCNIMKQSMTENDFYIQIIKIIKKSLKIENYDKI